NKHCRWQWECHVECFPGWTAAQLLELDDRQCGIAMAVAEDAYDAVVLFAGTNDLGHGEAISTVLARIAELLQRMRDAKSQGATSPTVIVMSVPRAKTFNKRLQRWLV